MTFVMRMYYCSDIYKPMSMPPTLTPSFTGNGEIPFEFVMGGTADLPFSEEE